ncbi:hypothetical protein DMA15_20965 [Streptomyces sp. WAC 01529]|uniref:DUF5667 domain-containing protein n=1 Tax=Streptomyces sp. WAC 01529 TaxID=2203205 RepID=UPI000F6D528D|nr:DUF5667 domain-containing protein [Streptomyces sp. WAC 01529]AZM54721.1 hypothetical protein DMA15_20965 [Streptomyces sp. WAC 01529]
MIANVSAHRRANAFAQALEEHSDQDPAAEQSEQSEDSAPTAPAAASVESTETTVARAEPTEQGRMLALADGLDALPKPVLDPEVKVVQRAQLVAAMEAMFLEGGAGASVPEQRSRKGAHRAGPLRKLRPRSRLSKGIAAGGLTVGVAAGAFGGVAAASSDALPGDSLYGLKRGMEDLKLGMADGDVDRGRLYLDQASTRLNEARRLMERGRSGTLDHESLGEVRRALSGMRHDATEGHRLLLEAYERDGSLGPIQALSAFSRSHRESWSDLQDRLPVQLGDVGAQVDSVFDAMDEEVEPLRALLPRAPEKGGPSGRSPQRPSGSEGTDGRPSAPSGSGGGHRGDPGDSGKPRPSSPHSQGDDVLGGSVGGLLDPPDEKTTQPPSAGKPKPGKDRPSAKPDVTLPPLLPGLLPELGIEEGDAK